MMERDRNGKEICVGYVRLMNLEIWLEKVRFKQDFYVVSNKVSIKKGLLKT